MINILLRTKFNDLTAENLAARLKQTKLTIKDGTGDFIKKKHISTKLSLEIKQNM